MAAKASGAKAQRGPTLSDRHKAALAEGREQGLAVRRYLQALESFRTKGGRKRTPEEIKERLAELDELLDSADVVSRLYLLQERMDLESELEMISNGSELASLEADFVRSAGPWSRRKGITYEVWRAAGVEARVLDAAGIGQGSRLRAPHRAARRP
jgi:hypothetical protein